MQINLPDNGEVGEIMEDEEKHCSRVPFICSIVPILVGAVAMGFIAFFLPEIFRSTDGCFGGLVTLAVIVCVGFPIVILGGVLGAISVSSGLAALKEPVAKGRRLVMIAIALGILEIATFVFVFGMTLKSCVR